MSTATLPSDTPLTSAPRAGAALRLDRLTKRYDSVTAVHDVSLTIPAGSFVTLLGPSGSGKTTTLNLIAGFLEPDAGEIMVDDERISGVPPHKRNIGMVFQSYALFPHMTVLENVAFPLRMRSTLRGNALRARVAESLSLVQLAGYEARYPRQLSGGQQQRVAMARALVSRPRLLLMDESLGALDKRLRERLQVEIKAIHRTVGTTVVYVTHDQIEALTMSDLIVVMHEGRIVEVGAPRVLYEEPATEFVADFLGGANLIPGTLSAIAGAECVVTLSSGDTLRVPARPDVTRTGSAVRVLIRPEEMGVLDRAPADVGVDSLTGEVLEAVYHGDATRVVVALAHGPVVAKLAGRRSGALTTGDPVVIWWPRSSARLIPASA